MAEVTVSSELIERLTARIEALEKKLDEKESEGNTRQVELQIFDQPFSRKLCCIFLALLIFFRMKYKTQNQIRTEMMGQLIR